LAGAALGALLDSGLGAGCLLRAASCVWPASGLGTAGRRGGGLGDCATGLGVMGRWSGASRLRWPPTGFVPIGWY
jgi:hypothetical protein